jgi:uncharacterized protein (DUF924 family)
MDITKCKKILDYWFPKDGSADYNKWFIKSKDYDQEIKDKFGDLLKEAEKGKGYGWLVSKDSFVAYIILMDQFSRHIYRGKGDAFKNDKGVLIFTELGFDLYKNELKGYEIMFAFMPYMHTESFQYQEKGRYQFDSLINNYTTNQANNSIGKKLITHPSKISLMVEIKITQNDKDYNILRSMEEHVLGHRNVIQRYGRFPKRNKALNRKSTEGEIIYMQLKEVQNRPY